MVIAHGVCVGSWERFTTNVVPHALGPIYAISGQTSIGIAYNSILDACQHHRLDALILQHDDLEIVDPDTEVKLLAAIADGAAVIGVAGARGVTNLAWWNFDTIGHQLTDSRLLDFGPRTGDVDGLEGSFIAFSPWAVARLRFEPWPGFHGYDVMIARKAVEAGKRVVVADVDTHHHVQLGFKSQASEGDWLRANEWFREKVNDYEADRMRGVRVD